MKKWKLVAQLCLTVISWTDCSLPGSSENLSWDFPCKDTGLGCHFLLQGIFLTQGLNLDLYLLLFLKSVSWDHSLWQLPHWFSLNLPEHKGVYFHWDNCCNKLKIFEGVYGVRRVHISCSHHSPVRKRRQRGGGYRRIRGWVWQCPTWLLPTFHWQDLIIGLQNFRGDWKRWSSFIYYFKNIFYSFICLWLLWVCVDVCGFSRVAMPRLLLLQSTGPVAVARGLRCLLAHAVFPDPGSNSCPLHWQGDS